MKLFKIIFFIIIILMLVSKLKVRYDEKRNQKEAANTYKDNLNACIYSPFTKINPPYFQGTEGYIKPNRADNERDYSYPRKIKTYTQIGPNKYRATNFTLNERIPVKVIDENITKDYLGIYGYITVQCLDTLQDKLFIISDNSFSAIRYWECPFNKAVLQAPTLAKLKLGVEPPTYEGEWVKLSEKAVIICVRVYGHNQEYVEGYIYDPLSKINYSHSININANTLIPLEF
jgi:hypothetical protein